MTPSRTARSLLGAVGLAMCTASLANAGTTYCVDTNNPAASDHGPGSQTIPFKTIQHAAKQLNYTDTGGNTVLVEPGIYYEKVTLYSHGAPGDTNVVRADGPGVI